MTLAMEGKKPKPLAKSSLPMQDGEVVEQVALDPSGAGWVQHQARRFGVKEFCRVPAEAGRFLFALNSSLMKKRRRSCFIFSALSGSPAMLAVIQVYVMMVQANMMLMTVIHYVDDDDDDDDDDGWWW